MRCRQNRFCNNLIFSTSVTVTADALVINVPNMSGRCGCLAIVQAIPDTATVDLPVVVTVGTDTTQYPMVDRCGVQLSAGRLDVYTRYQYKFVAANTQSIFKVRGVRCPYNTIP